MWLFSTMLSTISIGDFIDSLLNPDSLLRSVMDLIIAIIAIGGFIFGAVAFFRRLWKRVISPCREYKSFVDRVYSKDTRKAIAKYYIPTRAQDVDPCEFDEIRENNGNYITQPLIPFFCNDAFKSSSQGKYYLVLADSGMGKTTFMLRLYRKCLFNRSLQKQFKTKLIPLSQDNCIQIIEKTSDQENTILLLDALDENRDAIKDYESFLEELLRVTEGFNKIVITCRTQFFPNRATEPSETGRIRIGRGKKKEEIVKKYISPFSDEEVKLYLKKQYKFHKRKQQQAYDIVKKVPVLMARPVILNWINFLCDSTEEFKYGYQIYSAIIDKWIERENIGHTKRSLFDLSQAIAAYMFSNSTTSMSADKVEEIAAQKDIQLEPIIAKSRSLLNRNGNGEYKFAHRSFFEFFVVFSIFQSSQLPENLNFLFSLSGAKRFLFEILLDRANDSNPDMYTQCYESFKLVKRFFPAETLLDFVSLREMVFTANNTPGGFKIKASIKLKESEKHDPQHILFINRERFVDTSIKGKLLFKFETATDIELYFDMIKTQTLGPDIKMKLTIALPEYNLQTMSAGH